MNASIVNRKVLMLNQNYEPLTVTSARRAVVLVLLGKAEMIETANGFKLHTVAREYSVPSIVRLWEYKKVPYRRVILTRRNVLLRDGHRCQYCGTSRGPMTVDHVIPKRLHGSDTWENLVCACERCNNRKGDRSPEAAHMRLKKRPARPTLVTFIQRHIGVVDQGWRPYLFMDSSC